MSKNSDHVKKWRRVTKQRMVAAMGGCCVICGFKEFDEALEFHHLDPSVKDFSFGAIIANPKKWESLVVELRKCVMLCANCHRGVENEHLSLPDTFAKFNESYATYREVRPVKPKFCRGCNVTLNTFNKARRFCTNECQKTTQQIRQKKIRSREYVESLRPRKTTWPERDQLAQDIDTMSWVAIGRKYSVSDNAVRKWAKSYGLL